MSTLEVNTITPQSGTTLTLGGSGQTIALGSGASAGFGKVINVAQNTSNTRTALSNSASYTFMSFSYNQQKVNSKIRIDMNFWGFGEASGATNIKIGYNSTF